MLGALLSKSRSRVVRWILSVRYPWLMGFPRFRSCQTTLLQPSQRRLLVVNALVAHACDDRDVPHILPPSHAFKCGCLMALYVLLRSYSATLNQNSKAPRMLIATVMFMQRLPFPNLPSVSTPTLTRCPRCPKQISTTCASHNASLNLLLPWDDKLERSSIIFM